MNGGPTCHCGCPDFLKPRALRESGLVDGNPSVLGHVVNLSEIVKAFHQQSSRVLKAVG